MIGMQADVINQTIAVNAPRVIAWNWQHLELIEEAIIDSDGNPVVTAGECIGGIEIRYKVGRGTTTAVELTGKDPKALFIIINRRGNRSSVKGRFTV